MDHTSNAIHVELLTLPFRPAVAAFDTAPLAAFLCGKEPCALRTHVFTFQGMPHLLCVVSYRTHTGTGEPAAAPRLPATVDLTPPERERFDRLRAWRKARARDDGVPPYVILHDRELAAVVRRRPESLAALGEVRGLGAQKLARYGADILATLAGGNGAEPSAAADGGERG
jgi:superfamily II DNA helicase RecQ